MLISQTQYINDLPLLRIGLAAAQALGKRGARVVVSSRKQANVDQAVALLQSQSIQVIGTTCNVGKGEDREKLVRMVRNCPSCWHKQVSHENETMNLKRFPVYKRLIN